MHTHAHVHGCVCVHVWYGCVARHEKYLKMKWLLYNIISFLVVETRPRKLFDFISVCRVSVFYFRGKRFWDHSNPLYWREGHLSMLFWIDLCSTSTLSPFLEGDPYIEVFSFGNNLLPLQHCLLNQAKTASCISETSLCLLYVVHALSQIWHSTKGSWFSLLNLERMCI